MNIGVISCIHGDIENLMKFFDKLSILNIDVLVCPGDFTNFYVPKGFSRIDIARIILEELKGMKLPILAVPGSWDKELIEFLEKEDVSIHGKGKIIKDVGFYGYGGAKTPFNTPFEPSEEEILLGLEKSFNEVKKAKIKVQVTHAPPLNTKLDIIGSGAHVGSNVVREFIERNQPQVAVCAHIHESRGVDEINNTKIINSGRFPEGYFGLINIEKNSVTVKLNNLI